MLKPKIKSLGLQIIIFLRLMIRYTKILLPRPQATPSKEAAGRGVSRFATAMLPQQQTAHHGGSQEKRSILDFQFPRQLSTVFPPKKSSRSIQLPPGRAIGQVWGMAMDGHDFAHAYPIAYRQMVIFSEAHLFFSQQTIGYWYRGKQNHCLSYKIFLLEVLQEAMTSLT